MTVPTITINLDKKCAECSQPGAADSGICLKCTGNAVSGRQMKSAQGKAVAQRMTQMRDDLQRARRAR